MIVPLLALFLAGSPPPVPPAPPPRVFSVVSQRSGGQLLVRMSVDTDVESYSAVREGADVVVRIAAIPVDRLVLPAAGDPVESFALGTDAVFTLRVKVPTSWSHEIVRESSSFVLILRPVQADSIVAAPSSTPPVLDSRAGTSDPDTLYRQLFPSLDNPTPPQTEAGLAADENWYSSFRWLGLQARPWVAVSYVDGSSTLVQVNEVTKDHYLVIQPNLGIGLSPRIGGSEGRWKANYTPRFRRLVDLQLPHLTSHFFDAGVDQPLASLGSVYANYHHSRGVLETAEIDPGREYGIGRNRVADSSLEQFRRNSLGLGVRLEFVADTLADINVDETRVAYGNRGNSLSERAFFDYKTRTLNASIKRGLGEGRFMGLLFSLLDNPAQEERGQIEGRGYLYGVTLDGSLAALTTGRLMLGYRTQKNPRAGAGGRDYKDLTYGAQVLRELTEESTIGIAADRKLYLSGFADNGFYVADSIRGDFSARVPLSLFLRANAGLQTNGYRTSPQVVGSTSSTALRKDTLLVWSVALSRNLTDWAYLRADYTVERRNSNLDQFDIRSRALTLQIGLGFFGKAESQGSSSW